MTFDKIEVLDKVEKVVYLTQPSPIVLVSTISKNKIRNLAPFAMFTPCSNRPPMVAVGISQKSDTFRNIKATRQFVIGIPSTDILPQLYKAGNEYPPEVDEFIETGLTPYKSKKVEPARIAECVVNFECELNWHKEAGNHHIFVGLVVAADINCEIFNSDKVKLRSSIPRVCHITGGTFLVNGELVNVKG
jgi:flavin reductase (DIM6/NTAB) family NADH-FMN oxidoreductase RutF